MADDNLDVVSIEELEEIVLEMKRAADKKAIGRRPRQQLPPGRRTNTKFSRQEWRNFRKQLVG